MSVKTMIVGFKPPDEKWQRMQAVWNACVIAGIEIPEIVTKFFNDTAPDVAGIQINREQLFVTGAVREYHDNGFEITLDLVPDDVKIIRVYNYW
jgi:hypothetical protein